MRRQPAVAHQFYPGDPDTLARTVRELMPEGQAVAEKARAVISPHAGYIYSGGVAGATMAQVTVPDTVIIMGPNHHGLGARVAVMTSGTWVMPMGEVEIDSGLAMRLCQGSDLVTDDNLAHRHEHSLEVQVPFLQARNPGLRIVPLVLSRLSLNECLELGMILARAINDSGKEVLIVASSDMTHYEPREQATAKDKLALARVLDLDPQGLFITVVENRITMCGVIPVTATLAAARELGCTKARLIEYSDSGETSGDTGSVVGYAGIIVS